jgi:predicted nucleic acid-binding protein
MILVVDANIVIAALIRNGKSREILLSGKFKFVAPDFVKEETLKYLDYIKKKTGMSKDDLNLLVVLVFQEIQTIPQSDYETEIDKAKGLMKEDIKDSPYVACYLALKCDGIWTNDPDYVGKEGVKVYTTEYLMRFL